MVTVMRGLILAGLLIAGSAFAAERQAEVCGDSTRHQSGYCPANLSSGGYSSVGETTVNCTAVSDVADGTQYACVTSSSTPLAAGSVNACSGGAAVSGNSAAVSGSGTQTVGITGLTVDNSYYCQSANLSPEQWYSDVVVSSQFTTSAPVTGDNATRINAIFAGRTPPNITDHTQYYPADPVITDTTTCASVTSATQFNNCADDAGTRITITSSFSGNVHITASDIDVIMDNSLTLSGYVALRLGGGATPYINRVRWTGGNIGAIASARANDVLFDDVYATATVDTIFESVPEHMFGYGNPADRNAIINSTLEVDRQPPGAEGTWAWALHPWMGTSSDGDHGQGFIVANVKVLSNNQNNRFISADNVMIVDSVFNPDGASGNGMRIHGNSTHFWIRDSWSVGLMKIDWTESDTGTQVTDAYFDNYDRYDLNMFSSMGANTGEVRNSTVYGGTFNSSPLTDGGGNASASWDGSTVPDYSGIGAIR